MSNIAIVSCVTKWIEKKMCDDDDDSELSGQVLMGKGIQLSDILLQVQWHSDYFLLSSTLNPPPSPCSRLDPHFSYQNTFKSGILLDLLTHKSESPRSLSHSLSTCVSSFAPATSRCDFSFRNVIHEGYSRLEGVRYLPLRVYCILHE